MAGGAHLRVDFRDVSLGAGGLKRRLRRRHDRRPRGKWGEYQEEGDRAQPHQRSDVCKQVQAGDVARAAREQHEDRGPFDEVLAHDQVRAFVPGLRHALGRDGRDVEQRQKRQCARQPDLREQAEYQREADQHQPNRHDVIDPPGHRRLPQRVERASERTGGRLQVPRRAPRGDWGAAAGPSGADELVIALVQEMPANERPEQHEGDGLEPRAMGHHGPHASRAARWSPEASMAGRLSRWWR